MDTDLLLNQAPLWYAASDAEAARIAKMTFLVRRFLVADPERNPWTVTLPTGYKTILWMPVKAAVELADRHGVDCLASSADDLARDWWRSRQASGAKLDPFGFGCDRCTRFDTCGNHEQHSEGCHCLYRGDFWYAYDAGGVRLTLCANHRDQAPNPAATVMVEFG